MHEISHLAVSIIGNTYSKETNLNCCIVLEKKKYPNNYIILKIQQTIIKIQFLNKIVELDFHI